MVASLDLHAVLTDQMLAATDMLVPFHTYPHVVGRKVFHAHGLEPQDFDLVVVKSPNGYRTWYQSIAAQMIPSTFPDRLARICDHFPIGSGAHRTTVRAYASVLFGDTPEQTAQLARDFVAMGLTAAKFGWGPFGKDAVLDLEQVTATREALGHERDLMVDAGHAWEWPTALDRARLLAPLQIRWLEEPLSQDDRAGYARLCPQSPVPIAAGEGDVTHWDFEDLLERGLHVVQPDVAFCGGLTVCRQVSRMAEERDRRVVPHCFSTGINLAASLHWMASVPSGDLVEYCLRPSPLMRKLVTNLPPLVGGHVSVPNGAGLGIELDEAIIDEFRVRS